MFSPHARALRRATLVGFAGLIIFSSCSNGEGPPVVPTASPPRSTAPDAVRIERGFFDPEQDATGLIWRWMGKEGFVSLVNTHQDYILHLSAGAPVDGATLRLEVNDQLVGRFVLNLGNFERQITVQADLLGDDPRVELHIVTSDTLQSEHDTRALGLRVFSIDWYPQ